MIHCDADSQNTCSINSAGDYPQALSVSATDYICKPPTPPIILHNAICRAVAYSSYWLPPPIHKCVRCTCYFIIGLPIITAANRTVFYFGLLNSKLWRNGSIEGPNVQARCVSLSVGVCTRLCVFVYVLQSAWERTSKRTRESACCAEGRN